MAEEHKEVSDEQEISGSSSGSAHGSVCSKLSGFDSNKCSGSVSNGLFSVYLLPFYLQH